MTLDDWPIGATRTVRYAKLRAPLGPGESDLGPLIGNHGGYSRLVLCPNSGELATAPGTRIKPPT